MIFLSSKTVVFTLMTLISCLLVLSLSAFADQSVTGHRNYIGKHHIRMRRDDTSSKINPVQPHDQVHVTKVEAPYWTKPEQMERKVINEPLNSNVKLKCLTSGVPKPDIKWMKDGVDIASVSRSEYQPAYVIKPSLYRLRIPYLSKQDEGYYTCIVSNPYGTLNHTFKVETQEFLRHEPVLIEQSPNQTVMVGMSARLKCRFKADLATRINWLRPSKKIRHNVTNFDKVKDKNQFDFVRDARTGHAVFGQYLDLKNVTLDDAGFYFCVGQTNSARVPGILHLTVLDRHQSIIEKPKNVTVRAGETATFSCHTHIKLHQHTSWVRIFETDIQELAEETEAYRIENTTKEDAGIYACVVGNGQASFQEVAHLEVRDHDVPPALPIGSNNKKMSIIAGIISLLAAVLFVAALYVFIRCRQERFKKQQAIENARSITQWTKKVIIERQVAHYDLDAPIVAPVIRIEKQSSVVNSGNRSRLGSENTTLTTVSEYELPLDPDWEFPRSQLELLTVLGEGAFGKVMKARAQNIKGDGQDTIVAVKMLKEGHTDQEMIDLVSEMDMMKMIRSHDNNLNVVHLLGVCTQDGPLYVIVEYAENGNLRDYLRHFNDHNDGYVKPNSTNSNSTISARQLISFARQICKGMEFLGSRKCIHRDLAARNVLVTKDLIIKIADFGLARDVQANDYYRKTGDGRLPVKWMAPETLFHRRYTTQSDVWSFGILLWEIMTLGANPYPSVSMEKLFHLLRDGHRMECPPNCPLEIYLIMRECWNADPTSRPTFTKLIDDFDKILTYAAKDYLDMGFPLDNVCADNSDFHTQHFRSSSPIKLVMNGNGFQNHAYQNGPTITDLFIPQSNLPAPPSYSDAVMMNEVGGVTYTPLLNAGFWRSESHGSECSTNTGTGSSTSQYVNQPSVSLNLKLNYLGHNDLDLPQHTPSPMEEITLDDYRENYSEHVQSSAL